MYRKPGQAARARRAGKGDAIVAADGPRQAQLMKGPIYHGPNPFGRRRHDPAFDKEPAVGIGEGQRIAPLAVPGPKPALEVYAPTIIGLAHLQERSASAAPAGVAGAEACSIPPAATSLPSSTAPARRSPANAAPARLAASSDPSSASPGRTRDDRLGDLACHRLGRPMRRTRSGLQARHPFRLVAPPQLVAVSRLMPNCSHSSVIVISPFRRATMKLIFSSIAQVSFHGIGRGPPCRKENLSGIFPVYFVRYVSGPDRGETPSPRPSPPYPGARGNFLPLYRALKREREGPTAKPWEGEGRAGEHHADGETPSPRPSPPFRGARGSSCPSTALRSGRGRGPIAQRWGG